MDRSIKNAIHLGNSFVAWQSPYGSPDPTKCPYRTPGDFKVFHLHSVSLMARALYRLYDATQIYEYKVAADRYAVFMMNAVHNRSTESHLANSGFHRDRFISYAWVIGKALSPCYEWFAQNNAHENPYEVKAYALYQWLQEHRRDDSYFGVGYPVEGVSEDAQFSCDLGEVGSGLVGFYAASGHEPALNDAKNLARFFLTEWEQDSGKGVWSSQLGTWLVGPWSATGAEHMTDQVYSQTAWGFSAQVVGEFLLRLYEYADPDLQKDIAEKCNSTLRWCIDQCQFEDGAHGMFGRDDKWVGMTAAAILLYVDLKRTGAICPQTEAEYMPQLQKAWRWLVDNTQTDTMPGDGYIKVQGTTTKSPLENIVWMLAWTVEALVLGRAFFEQEEQ